MKKVIWMLGLLTVFTLSSCGSVTITLPNTTPTTGNNPTGGEPHWGVQTKTSGCRANGGLSDSACTPGAILATGTKEAICQSGYASNVRNVPTSVKNQVYAEYDIRSHAPGQYEVDHLVSLELGGSNDLSNLWPELASPKPGFHEKDSVENYLHSQVCSGAMALKEAQIEIATNWLAVYQKMAHSQRSREKRIASFWNTLRCSTPPERDGNDAIQPHQRQSLDPVRLTIVDDDRA